jgi:Chromo (CHRromatin Organisation MOdifier) domain
MALPSIEKDDSVYLLRKFIKTQKPSDKLDHKKLDPFKVLKKILNNVFELQLPSGMKIHNVFHISLLEKFSTNTLRPSISEPPIIEIDNENYYKVDEIFSHRTKRRKTQYLVRWTGYPSLENTWESEDNLTHASDALQVYKAIL